MDYNFMAGTPPENSDDTYFAMKPAQALAANCMAKAASFYNNLSSNEYLDLLRRQYYAYHNLDGDGFTGGSHQIGFTGKEGELVKFNVNHYRNIAQHILQMITATRPTMEATAVNTDYKSITQAYLANSILEYYMREKSLESCIRRVTEMAVVLGAGFIRMEWNATAGDSYDADPDTKEINYTGELEFSTHSPFDVVFDGTKDSWDNAHEWILLRDFKNKYNLAAKYPELRQKILNVASANQLNQYRLAMFSNDDTDDIAIYEFYHKKTEACPEGRYVLFVDSDTVLLDIPLPYREIPIYRISAGEFMGTPYGYTTMFDLYSIQEVLNASYSAIATNQSAFAVQNLWVENGSDIEINSLEGAMNIITGNKKPESLNLAQSPKEVFDFIGMNVQSMETISGVNSVARGDPQASLKSGTALALVQSQALQFISGLQDNYVKLIERIGGSLLNILKDFANTPKTMELVGKNNRAYLAEAFTGDQIDSINRVIVTVGNPLAKTAAGRTQMAEQMLQMGLVTTPQVYFEVITTGSIESLYESDMDELLLIKDENEQLLAGEDVMAEILDKHAEHIKEHRSVMANPSLRRNAALRQKVQQHVQEHINFLRTVDPDLLMLVGEKPLAAPAAPQVAPNMPPPQNAPAPGGAPSSVMQNQQPPDLQAMQQGQGSAGPGLLPQPAQPPQLPQQ
jgi:hypothetical protein